MFLYILKTNCNLSIIIEPLFTFMTLHILKPKYNL